MLLFSRRVPECMLSGYCSSRFKASSRDFKAFSVNPWLRRQQLKRLAVRTLDSAKGFKLLL